MARAARQSPEAMTTVSKITATAGAGNWLFRGEDRRLVTRRGLAYLGFYPELARVPDPDCGYLYGRGHRSWIVVLHVPAFAALHATVHDSDDQATPGPVVPHGTQPSRAQLRALPRGDNTRSPGPAPACP